jgi:catechol 2,3-dioxygenase-like lactoylglutathione lyase family enzyme
MILGFGHPAIVVQDLERSTKFYCEAFGFKVFSDANEGWCDNLFIDTAIGLKNSKAVGRMLSGHNCYLELFQFSHPSSVAPNPAALCAADLGLRHLCFYTDDVEKEYSRAIALGASTLGRPQKSSGIAAVYIRDPEGNIIELAEFPSQSEDLRNLPGVHCLQGET